MASSSIATTSQDASTTPVDAASTSVTSPGTATTADTPSSSSPSTKPSTSTGKRNKVRYHNFLRAGDAQQVAVQALRPYVQWAAKAQHAKLLATPITPEVATAAGCANTSSATTSMTLKDVPPCEEHVRAPESTRIRHKTLKQCKRCNPWLEAMGAAHADGKVDKLNAANIYPNTWRDDPWAVAKAYVSVTVPADSDINHADATCLVNIMIYYRAAFSDLTDDDRARLAQLRKVRNDIAHKEAWEVSTAQAQEWLQVCRAVLAAGPWTKPPFAEATSAALQSVVAVEEQPMELLPQLEELKPHYVRQGAVLEWLKTALASHRVVALSGLGGIGKSTSARAFAWQQATAGAFPGRHGVLWASAAASNGGMTGALLTVVQARLAIAVSPADASNAARVRQLLQSWARARKEPWLLVLDSVEPGVKEGGLQALLGNHGVALLTTRAGPRALYLDMGVPRAAALRLACLSTEDAYKLVKARYMASVSVAASDASLAPWPTTEEAAVRELAGATGLGGLPLALEQAAAIVGSTPGQSFVGVLAAFRAASGGAAALPGGDGDASELGGLLAVVVTECGLQGVDGLVDWLGKECESMDDVQWLVVEDVTWGPPASDGTPCAASTVQKRKWAKLQEVCKERSASTQHRHTVASVWATQLKVLPKYCVEVLQAASCFAPQHVPQVMLVKALVEWVGGTGGGGRGSSDLVGEMQRRAAEGGASNTRLMAEAVIESALQRLEDVSLVQRGVWQSAEAIHPQLASGQFAMAQSQSPGGGVQQASGGAGQGAGAGGGGSAESSVSSGQLWFSMHRLVQSVVRGSDRGAVVAAGRKVLVSLSEPVKAGVAAINDVLTTATFSGSREDMELAAWLVAHDHAVGAVGVLLPWDGSEEKAAKASLLDCVEALSKAVVPLGAFGKGDLWVGALQAVLVGRQGAAGSGDSSAEALSLNTLAALLRKLSRYDEAEPLFMQALAMELRLRGDSDSDDLALVLVNLGRLYMHQSRYVEAEPLYVQALASYQRLHGGSDSRDVARSVNHLASLYKEQSRYDEAEPLFEQALAMRQRMHGDSDSSDVAQSLTNLALLYLAQSRYDEAEPLLVQALAMVQRLHGDSDSSDVAAALNNLAELYYDQSRYDEAEPLVAKALAMEQRLHGDSDSSDVAESLNNLGTLYTEQSRYDEAEPLFEQALAMRKRLHGDSDSSDVASTLHALAGLYASQSRYDEAELLYVQALAIEQRLHGDRDSSEVATSLNNLAVVYKAQSRYDEAEPLFVQALAMRQRLHGDSDSSAVAGSLHNLAELYQAQSRYDEAEPLFVQALAVLQRIHSDTDHYSIATTLDNLANLYDAQHNSSYADSIRKQADEMRQRLESWRTSYFRW